MTTRWKMGLAAAASAAIAAVGVIALSGRASEPADASVPGDSVPATTPAGEADPAADRTITVTGHGSVSVVPDTADLSTGVQATAATATEALETMSTTSQGLMDALEGAGIAAEDIQTSGLSLYPTFGNDGQRITGYTASTSVTATIHDVSTIGAVVDALKGMVGENLTLGGISFSYDDPEAVLADARTGAIANAKVRAGQYAEAAGAEVGDILRIVEGTVPDPILFREAAPMAAEASGVAIAPGTQDLTADVTVVFAMT